MRRRLDLAAALIGRPRVLFLDEPTTGLDPRGRLGMWDVIRTQVREGATLLLTTQYLEEADELANEIAVVDKGKIIARGTADELKSQVGGERIEVVAHEPADLARAAAAARARRDRDASTSTRGGSRSPPTAAPTQLVEVVRRLGEAGIKIDDIAPAPADARRRLPRADRPRSRGAAETKTRRRRLERAPRSGRTTAGS